MVTLIRYYTKTLADLGTNKVVALLPAWWLLSFRSQAMKQYADGGRDRGDILESDESRELYQRKIVFETLGQHISANRVQFDRVRRRLK
mgnify:CR=1 FL=1